MKSTTPCKVASTTGWLVPASGKAQNRALPQVVIIALRDRDVELIGGPRLDALQNAPLALE